MECSRGTTSDEEDVEDEGNNMPSPLEGADNEVEGNLTRCVAEGTASPTSLSPPPLHVADILFDRQVK
jgi:hypothetical protein